MSGLIGGAIGLVSVAVFLACVGVILWLSIAFPFLGLLIVTQTLGYRYWRRHRGKPAPPPPAPRILNALDD